jgi:hypothetical protein
MNNRLFTSSVLAVWLALSSREAQAGPQSPSPALTNVPDEKLTFALDSRYEADTNNVKHNVRWHAVWTMVDKGNKGAFSNQVIHGNDTIMWVNTNNQDFSILVTNRSDWLTGTMPWRTNVCECLFNQAIGIIDSTPDPTNAAAQIVTLQFSPRGSVSNVYAYRICIPPIPGTNAFSAKGGGTALLWPAAYSNNMVEATLSWDGSTSQSPTEGK